VAPGFTHVLDATRNDSDPDHDRLRIASVIPPAARHGRGRFLRSVFLLQPEHRLHPVRADAGYLGIDAVPYTVSDGRGGTASAIYHLVVGDAVPNVAAITPDSGPTSGGQAVRITGSNFVFGSESECLCPAASRCPSPSRTHGQRDPGHLTPAGFPGLCALRVRTRFGRTGDLANAYTYAGSAPVDSDGDGVPDPTDNCPLHANPDQADHEADGLAMFATRTTTTTDSSTPTRPPAARAR
jgi:hypothetical protein